MSYEEKLRCIRTKCGGQLTIPIKLVTKGDVVIDVARCSNCRRSYKFLLPLSEKSLWLPLINLGFFSCDVCGTSNIDNWKYQGHTVGASNRIKVVMRCKNCGHNRAKVATDDLWNDLKATLKKPAEPPPPATFNCPHCNMEVAENTSICPNCNIEILCDKCGSPIRSNAKFCGSCGDPVEKIEASPGISHIDAQICPVCQEEFEAGSIFCPVCGQELVCDKCGTVVREGALFCVNCGDEIKKGELSE